MSFSLPSSSITNLREYFNRENKDKISRKLKRALSLLHIHDLDELEEQFLATEAFLEPWSAFRDSIFLMQPGAMSNATSIKSADISDGITRMELLWFYTQFDGGILRYDPRSDPTCVEYTTDCSLYGRIDKSKWGVQEYEKHLFAWLLQNFKVGKRRNPWGFDYFELQQLCSAWEEVLVPIINTVRASYNVKGRQHYGRLALFIESKFPSRLAFPEGNVTVPGSSLASPTPFRVVSWPKTFTNEIMLTSYQRAKNPGILTKKHYEDTEKELREVYPMFGGLVERPKFKYRMDEWLAVQKERAACKKQAENQGEVKAASPRLPKANVSFRRIKNSLTVKVPRRKSSYEGRESPLKRYSDGLRHSFSHSSSKKLAKESPKSPLHGVTRLIDFPDDKLRNPSILSQGSPRSKTKAERSLRLKSIQQTASDEISYSSSWNPNVLSTDEAQQAHKGRQACSSVSATVGGDIRQSSSRPWPLRDTIQFDRIASTCPDEMSANRWSELRQSERLPNHDGTSYGDEIFPANIHADRLQCASSPEIVPAVAPGPRRPILIHPFAYTLEARRAIAQRKRTTPTSLPWPGESPPQHVPWPGDSPRGSTEWFAPEFDDNVAPPIPPKSPARIKNAHDREACRASHYLVDGEERKITRFVSKENIRAQLGSYSEEDSTEDFTPHPRVPEIPHITGDLRPTRAIGYKSRLQTYNTHMFPRKDKAVGK